MQPQIHINYLAMAAAVVIRFIFDWLWYGPLFGKKWARSWIFIRDRVSFCQPANRRDDSRALALRGKGFR